MKKILASFALLATLAGISFANGADATGGAVPFWMEPDPMCGSDLHDEIDGECSTDAAFTIGRRECPNLSQARLDGEFYDFLEDPLGIILYSDAERIPLWIDEDAARTWDRYCVIPPLTPPVPDPTPVPFVCPDGYIQTFNGSAIVFVVPPQPADTPQEPAPVPSFTG